MIGVGILTTNLFGLSPFYVSVPVFLFYGAGWIALGASMRRDLRATPPAVAHGFR